MAEIVGHRFKPTNKEIILYFLALKIQGKGFLVDSFIGEVNIYNHDPWELLEYARITPGDNTCYFFYLPDTMSETDSRVKSMGNTGFWKPTARNCEIKDKNSNLIGIKKTLTFQENRSAKVSWVIHEYHHSLNLPHQTGYALCKLIYKGQDKIRELGFGSASGTNHQAQGNHEIYPAVVSTSHAEFENQDLEVFMGGTETLMEYFDS